MGPTCFRDIRSEFWLCCFTATFSFFPFQAESCAFARRTQLCGFRRLSPARRLMLGFLVRIREEALEIPQSPSSVSLEWMEITTGSVWTFYPRMCTYV